MRFGKGWDQFASEESINLSNIDPIVNAVKHKSLLKEKQDARHRMEWLKNRRIEQSQNLARRKAERETVENVSLGGAPNPHPSTPPNPHETQLTPPNPFFTSMIPPPPIPPPSTPKLPSEPPKASNTEST